MKTIQISDETYDFIKNLAQEMKEQSKSAKDSSLRKLERKWR